MDRTSYGGRLIESKMCEARMEYPSSKPEPETSPQNPKAPSEIITLDDYLLLKDLRCVDAKGNVFEEYPELYVRKDIERKNQREKIIFTPYQAAAYFEQKGMFLPSFALSCNILTTLFQAAVERDGKRYVVKDAGLQEVLDQYKDYGAGYGWHAQNTVVDWGERKIIHYPQDENFPEYGGSEDINAQHRTRVQLSFPAGIRDMTVADALKKAPATEFIRNFTGLENPVLFLQLGKYFGKVPWLWTSSSSETRAAWLGCISNGNFNLLADNYLNSASAARGVRLDSPQGTR